MVNSNDPLTPDFRIQHHDVPVRLSVIVPTHRRPATLARLLKALAPQVRGKPDRELIIVNDGSHDPAYGRAIEPYADLLTYVPIHRNVGRAAVRNIGARKSRGAYLVHTDDDCLPPENWLDRLDGIVDAQPDAAVITGQLRTFAQHPERLVPRYLRETEFLALPHRDGERIVCVFTANMVVRRNWFARVGGFDERLSTLGGCDRNLTYRLVEAGAQFHIEENWYTQHDDGFGLRDFCRRYHRYGYSVVAHLMLSDDTNLSGLNREQRRRDALRAMFSEYRNPFGAPRHGDGRTAWGLGFRFLSVLRRLSYEFGGARGFRDAAALRKQWQHVLPPSPIEMAPAALGRVTLPATIAPADISLSVIVPTYRRPGNLRRLLDRLGPQIAKHPNYSVVVVNDGSHDAEYEDIVAAAGGWLTYHALPFNRGPATARNVAARLAEGSFLVFTDDDCEPPETWLEWLEALIRATPYAAVIGGTTRHPPTVRKSTIASYLLTTELFPRPLYQRGEVFCFPTANLAVRRDWFDAVGGFEEVFDRAGGEDTNLTYKLKRAGAPAIVDDRWHTGHDINFGLRDLLKRHYRYGFGNAHQTLFRDDFSIDWLSNYPNIGVLLRQEIRNMRTYQNQPVGRAKPGAQRIIFYTLELAKSLAYQYGGMRGFREIGRGSIRRSI